MKPVPATTSSRGFTLIELLVALVVFAAMAAAAYGGLASIARARAALAAQQDRFAAVTRTVSVLERDLRQSVARSVLGNTGSQPLPALMGGSDTIEFSRLGYANPRAEPRSNLERVVYALDGGKLQRGRYLVLDRAPNSAPLTSALLDRVEQFHLRYFGGDGGWRDAWPPPTDPPQPAALPRAVEVRFVLADLGEIRRVVELVSTWPLCGAAGNGSRAECNPQ
ncbi:MAG: type II secretion system minor pseudopilin GspJ [Dokdonella sp.]